VCCLVTFGDEHFREMQRMPDRQTGAVLKTWRQKRDLSQQAIVAMPEIRCVSCILMCGDERKLCTDSKTRRSQTSRTNPRENCWQRSDACRQKYDKHSAFAGILSDVTKGHSVGEKRACDPASLLCLSLRLCFAFFRGHLKKSGEVLLKRSFTEPTWAQA
jgi:hypothetical protein